MHPLQSSAIAAVLAMTAATFVSPAAAQAQISIGISVNFAPPPLPVYDQPPIPDPDYLWIPGYWAWDDDYYDYYWVPGTWAPAPEPGLLWTPAWWGWTDGAYVFHDGYWAPQVGYYGGVVYGFGYDGSDYEGGEWRGDHFFYNQTVNNITNVNITNVYQRTVAINHGASASFNGPGGATAQPTAQQLAVAQERHVAPTPVQMQNARAAAATPTLRASANHGAPPVAATGKPASFEGPGVVKTARPGGEYQPPPSVVARQAQARAAHGIAAGPAERPAQAGAAAPAPSLSQTETRGSGGVPERGAGDHTAAFGSALNGSGPAANSEGHAAQAHGTEQQARTASVVAPAGAKPVAAAAGGRPPPSPKDSGPPKPPQKPAAPPKDEPKAPSA
jgi:hypothetical protein